MSRRCTVCAHREREAIDAALAAGEPYRGIARRYTVSPDAVERHNKVHVPAAMALASEAAAVAHGDDLLAQLRDLQARVVGLLDRAERAGDLRAAVAAVGQARGCLELLARLLGELRDRPTVNLLLAPEWLAVRGRLLAALAPFPEARAAVAKALTEVNDARG